MKTRHLSFFAALFFSFGPLSAAVPSWNGALTKTDRTITASWDANGNPPDTRYLVEASTRSDFQPGTVISSQTVLLTAIVNPLRGNNHYFVRLSALDLAPDTYADPIREITTLASVPAPQILGSAFVPDPTGITVRWLSNENADDTVYRVEAFSNEALTPPALRTEDTTNTSLRIEPLASNTTYWFTVKAKHADDAGYTAALNAGAAMTLPGNYSLTSTPPASDTIWYGADKSAITFMTDGFSSGKVAYFRYRWLPYNVYAWPTDDHQEEVTGKWDGTSGNLLITNSETGQFYLHIKAYNAVGKSDGAASEKVSNLFKIDTGIPTPDPAIIRDVIKTGNSITWNAAVGADDSGVNVRYGWSLNGGPEIFNVNNASVTANLLPNTAYTMAMRTRDTADSPNFSAGTSRGEVTLQKLPTSVTVLGVTETSVRVQINGDFPNLLLGDSGLQVQATDTQDTFVSNFEKTNVILLEGLNPNTIYNVKGCSRNQAGEVSGCTSSVPARTLGGSSAVTADAAPYNLPGLIGKYKTPKTITFTDNGAFASGVVSYYTMLLSGQPDRPSAVAQKQAIRRNAGTWSWTFTDTEEKYAHIQSYASDNTPIAGGYSLLGPWIFDGDAPQEMGGSTVTVNSVSQMTFEAGDVEDIGLAGLHAAPYSFDNGLTFQSIDSFVLSGLESNSLQVSTVVFRDAVGNVSQPIYLRGYTHQNAPTGVHVVSKNGKQVVVEADGSFPRLADNLTGIQFGLVNPDTTIDWRPQWLKETQTTYDFSSNNGSYRIVARARNADGVLTVKSPELEVNTQPTKPAVSPVSSAVGEWTASDTFQFKALELPGANTYDHYLYVWDKNETHTFDGTEASWTPASLVAPFSLSAPDSGKWYLHLISENASRDRSDAVTLGWFGRDITTPADALLLTPVAGTNSITWSTQKATDTMVGLHDEPYLWSLDGGTERATTINNLSFISLDLTPNTAHTISLRVRDRLGNILTVAPANGRTLAAAPRADAFEKVEKSSATVSFYDGGNPLGSRFEVEISAQENFSPLQEAVIVIVSNNSVPGKLKAEFGVRGTPLNPNTTYYVRVHALNADSVPTADVHMGTFTTRSLAPQIVINPNGPVHPKGTEFTATSQIAFGQGTVEFLRWVWHTSPGAYSWSNLDTKIDAQNPTINFTADRAGTFYLHVAAYSGGSTLNPVPETQVVGPFTILAPDGSSPEIVAIDKTDTTITVSQAPLPGITQYGFQLDDGDILYQGNSNRTFTGLTPNTKYRVRIYIKDAAEQPIGPVAQDVTTKQAKPSGVSVSDISTTTARLTALGDFSRMGDLQTGFHFTLQSGLVTISSPWLTSPVWVIPGSGLAPNTPYTVTVRARNSLAEETADSIPASFTTLAKIPNVANNQVTPDNNEHAPNGYYKLPKTFKFVNNGGWSQGNLEYYRVMVTNTADVPALADFDNDTKATTWVPNTKYSTEPVTAATYYMHFRSYNSANIGGDVYSYGPVYIDNEPPTPNPPELEKVEVFTDHVVWTAVAAVDVGGAGLPSSPYHFQFGTTDGAQNIWRDRDYTSPLNLQPNTTHTIVLAVRDNLGNTTNVLRASTYTLAAVPLPKLASLQVHITSATFEWDKKNNSNITRYEIGAFLTNDLTQAPALTVDAGVDSSSGSITRLNLDTVYWFGVRAINAHGHPTAWAGVGNGRTKNEIVAPIITEPLTIAADNVIMNWIDLNPVGTTYEVLNNEGAILLLGGTPVPVGDLLTKQFSGLTPNTTYSFGVRAKSQTAIYSSFASAIAVTLANTPTAATLDIHRTSATVTWAANGNPDGTKYEIRAATSAAGKGADTLSAFITGTEGQITGLLPDTPYFFSVRAVNHAGVPTAWLVVDNGVTGVQPPQPPYLFKSTTTTSFRLEWGSGTNPARVSYVIERSNDNFASNIVPVTTSELFVAPAGLDYNTTYYYRGKAVGTHSNESPVVPMGYIVTYATNPVAGTLVPALGSMRITWGENGNPAGTIYRYQVATDPVFQTLVRDVKVPEHDVIVDGLAQNTTHWVRIWAVNHADQDSQFFADNGSAVTWSAAPVIPILDARWNATVGNHVRVNISAGDLNPEHTEYAIFSLKDNAYLVGDAAGSVSLTPTWHTRFDWNSTSTHEGMGIHGNLLSRTEYQYKVIARNHANVSTAFSDPHPVLTVPAKPNFDVSVVDNNYARLNWAPWDQNAADALRVYVSETGTAGSFTQYFDFVDQFGHSIKPEGKKGVDEIPNSLSETRHDTIGGYPANMTALEFNQAVDAATDTLHFKWNTVASPSAAPLFFYYVVGLSGFGEEGQPSDVKSAQVMPVIKNYAISGTRTGSTTDNNYEFLAPSADNTTIRDLESNTHLRVQVKARSSDGIDSKVPSPFIDAWTLAHIPGMPVVTTAFDDVNNHFIYNNVVIDPFGNPTYTEYAIKWVEGNKYLDGLGGTSDTPKWFTKARWDEGYNHARLLSATQYTYQVVARNGALVVTDPSPSAMIETIGFQPPTQLSGKGETPTSIRWTWYDNTTDEIKFDIIEKIDPNLIIKVEKYSVSAFTTGFVDVVEQGLATPNTAVTRYVRGAGSKGPSSLSLPAIAWTLAADPEVESTNHQINVTSNEIKFIYKNNLVFGPGTVDHYRVKFTNSPTYTFTGTEERWDDATQIKEYTRDVIEPNTNWYLHVMSYNHDDTPSAQAKVYGPYPLFQDVEAPLIEEIRQDGAAAISGARDVSSIGNLLSTKKGSFSVKAIPTLPQLDASFAAGVPWAPTVQGLHIRFTKRLDGATLNRDTVLVHAIQNNLSQTISPKKAEYTVSYNDGERELNILFEQPGLPGGHLFEVRLTAEAKDVAGNSVPEEFRIIYYFRTFMNPSETNELVTLDPSGQMNMRLHFPAGSLPETGAVGVETDPGAFPWGFDNSSRQRANQKQVSIGGLFATPLTERFIGHFNAAHARTEGKLRSGAILSMPYRDDDNDGYVDSMPTMAGNSAGIKVKVANLSIYRFDEPTQLWVKVPGSHVDAENKMVVAVTYSMGVFAVIGTASTDVSASYAYPVPFLSSRDKEITFTNLPDSGKIKIYTVAGELVKEIQFTPSDNNVAYWRLPAVGADVYIYQITSGGNKKTGKLVIVK